MSADRRTSSVVKCLTCGKVMESKHRHDWVSCDCPRDSDTWMYIDGGKDYLRMGAGNASRWEVVDGE